MFRFVTPAKTGVNFRSAYTLGYSYNQTTLTPGSPLGSDMTGLLL
jgi:hypothetical protein